MSQTTDNSTSKEQLSGVDALAIGRLARELAEKVEADSAGLPVKMQMTVDGQDFGAECLPVSLVAKIADLLRDTAEGRDVAVVPADLLIGSESAAAMLGVSRPWVNTLIDRGDIPGEMNGTKRRVRVSDVVAFRRQDDDRRRNGQDWSFLDEPSENQGT